MNCNSALSNFATNYYFPFFPLRASCHKLNKLTCCGFSIVARSNATIDKKLKVTILLAYPFTLLQSFNFDGDVMMMLNIN